MKKGKFTCYDGMKLQSYTFDVENAKGVIQISHGMQEYAKTYFKFAKFMQEKGYIVYIIDQRAHGLSCAKEDLGKVDGDVFQQTVCDQLRVSRFLKETYNLPLYVLGHSYGSFIMQEYLKRNKFADKILLLGSGYMKNPVIWFGKIMASLTCAFKGKDAKAKLVEKAGLGAYANKFSDASWITSDEEETKEFYADELNGQTSSAGFYKSMFANQLKLYKDLKNVDKNLPIGIFSGSQDPVGLFSKGAIKLYNVYNKKGLNVSLKLYSKMRHNILQEQKKEYAFADILNFIEN